MSTLARRRAWLTASTIFVFLCAAGARWALGETRNSESDKQTAVNATTVVTAEGSSTEISAAAVKLSIERGNAHITALTPLRGDQAGLQLLILLDDSARRALALQFDDVKKFILGLPPTTEVGVAYMQNGVARFVQPYTTNHEKAAAALHIPSGTPGSNGSPYFVLSDLMKHWSPEQSNNGRPLRPGAVRREVLMFTDGVEAYESGRFDPENPYVLHAIADAQRAGVIVYAIYVRDIGLDGFANAEANNGQNYLVMLTDAVGGKTYYVGTFSSPDFRPYLRDVAERLNNQYELAFTANLKRREDSVGIRVKGNGVKLTAARRVFLTAVRGSER